MLNSQIRQTHWKLNSTYKLHKSTKSNQLLALEVYLQKVLDELAPGGFPIYSNHELVLDSYESRAKWGLAKKNYRALTPMGEQNPIFHSIWSVKWKSENPWSNRGDRIWSQLISKLVVTSTWNTTLWICATGKSCSISHERGKKRSILHFSSLLSVQNWCQHAIWQAKPGGAFFGNCPMLRKRMGWHLKT